MTSPRSRRDFLRLAATGTAAAFLGAGCRRAPTPTRRVHLTYWEKWTGDEGEAMRRIVDEFNRSQAHIYVEYLNISNIDRKLTVATAGGTPPDICGVWSMTLPLLADNGALEPLDRFIVKEAPGGAWMRRYYPILRKLVTHDRHVYALPTMHTTSGLFWNKTLFREVGLDPESPPRTLAEFEDCNRRLMRRDADTGKLERVGFLSSEPGFFHWEYLGWHGGEIWNQREFTLDTSPGNLAALRWIRARTEEIGAADFRAFASGAAGASNNSFSSPQNPFFTGRIGMQFCGMWLANFIRRLAPGLDFGCAPWPEAVPGVCDFTHAESDIIVMPRGCREPEAAWEFMRYLASNNPRATAPEELTGIERLGWLMRRLSPLREWSPGFSHNHPHPQIEVFRQLSESPHIYTLPRCALAHEVISESNVLFQRVRDLAVTPEEGLAYAQQRLSASWREHQATLARHRAARA